MSTVNNAQYNIFARVTDPGGDDPDPILERKPNPDQDLDSIIKENLILVQP